MGLICGYAIKNSATVIKAELFFFRKADYVVRGTLENCTYFFECIHSDIFIVFKII